MLRSCEKWLPLRLAFFETFLVDEASGLSSVCFVDAFGFNVIIYQSIMRITNNLFYSRPVTMVIEIHCASRILSGSSRAGSFRSEDVDDDSPSGAGSFLQGD